MPGTPKALGSSLGTTKKERKKKRLCSDIRFRRGRNIEAVRKLLPVIAATFKKFAAKRRGRKEVPRELSLRGRSKGEREGKKGV